MSAILTLPKLPHPDFPWRPHRNGEWCKSFGSPLAKRSEQFYFGTWADDEKGERALKNPQLGWLAREDVIRAGVDNVPVQPVAGEMLLGKLSGAGAN
jgi:hypothetical protein